MMRTTITARHCELSEALRTRARDVARRLGQLSPHALDATLVFDIAPLFHSVEIRLHARGRKMLKGAGRGPDHRTALDRAEDKLRPQLVKSAEVRQRSRRDIGQPRQRSQ
ncbi:MAG TPA: HPF/RaiA family ribosome-associated protein [Gemmatimonadales bacterium]|nr:HPF/RaiA family ribosome-associated protein [Gemmatimonadales bacterium]